MSASTPVVPIRCASRVRNSACAVGSSNKRLGEHIEAGADHVAIQVLGGWDKLLPTLTELAGPLGLKGR